MYPRISLVVPCLNAQEYISFCLESILSQVEYLHELIVVDGGSTDSTLAIISSYISCVSNTKLLLGPDNGQVDAMNKGLNSCTGDVITFVNSDDWLYQGCLKTVCREFTDNPSLDILFGGMTYSRDGEYSFLKVNPSLGSLIDYSTFSWPVNPVSYFCHRRIFEAVGIFPLQITVAMDYWFLLNALSRHPRTKLVPTLFGCFRLHGSNKSHISKDVYSQMRNCRSRLVLSKLDPYLWLLLLGAFSRETILPRLTGAASRFSVLFKLFSSSSPHN